MVDFNLLQRPLSSALHGNVVSVWTPTVTVNEYGERVQGAPALVHAAMACDVQSYSAELAQRDYGLVADVQCRMYTLGALELGQLVLLGDEWLRVVALPEGGAMTVALLRGGVRV